jgi:hypothetical protein
MNLIFSFTKFWSVVTIFADFYLFGPGRGEGGGMGFFLPQILGNFITSLQTPFRFRRREDRRRRESSLISAVQRRLWSTAIQSRSAPFTAASSFLCSFVLLCLSQAQPLPLLQQRPTPSLRFPIVFFPFSLPAKRFFFTFPVPLTSLKISRLFSLNLMSPVWRFCCRFGIRVNGHREYWTWSFFLKSLLSCISMAFSSQVVFPDFFMSFFLGTNTRDSGTIVG